MMLLKWPARRSAVTQAYPWLVAFSFGLLHGLGFAGGLLDAMSELPSVAIALAITAFSIGVELGHQAVVVPIYGGLALARRMRKETGDAGPVRSAAPGTQRPGSGRRAAGQRRSPYNGSRSPG